MWYLEKTETVASLNEIYTHTETLQIPIEPAPRLANGAHFSARESHSITHRHWEQWKERERRDFFSRVFRNGFSLEIASYLPSPPQGLLESDKACERDGAGSQSSSNKLWSCSLLLGSFFSVKKKNTATAMEDTLWLHRKQNDLWASKAWTRQTEERKIVINDWYYSPLFLFLSLLYLSLPSFFSTIVWSHVR